jgi:hypothetical protein
MQIMAIQDEQVMIGWAHITSIILNRSNEMKYPLIKQYGYHPSF